MQIYNKEIAGQSILKFCQNGGCQKTPILFVPGMWGTHKEFRFWAERVTVLSNRTTYVVNLPEHGKGSEKSVKFLTINQCLSSVSSVVKAIGDLHFVGHSLGGLIGQCLTSQCCEIKTATFVSSIPPAGIISPFQIRNLRLRYLWAMFWRKPVVLAYSDVRALFCNDMDEDLARKYWQNIVPESSRILTQILFNKPDVYRIDKPTLVVGGSFDPLQPPEVQRRMAEKIGSEIKWIENAGHTLHWGPKKGETIKKIVSWIDYQDEKVTATKHS